MFKKKTKHNNGKPRVEPEIDSAASSKQSKFKVRVEKPKSKKKKKKSSALFNWSIPLLLIGIGVGFLVMYPEPDRQTSIPVKPSKKVNAPVEVVFSAKSLSNELVSRYFNGTDEDKAEQKNALEKTLDVLNTSTDPQASKALAELQNSNINAAKKSLISLASTQKNLQEASLTWINIGNIQNLSSARQALQAYKKASEIDPENINAYSQIKALPIKH